jgi:RNA recognition motif-containing protein
MSAKLFVGNLDFGTTRDQLASLFAEVGPVQDVFLPVERNSGRPRGFAFVEYGSEADAERAIERFNGYELGGRALRVNAAEDRPRRPGGFGGGDRPSFGGGRGGYGGGKPKGSRRNIRAKKRSL